ncbi:NUDIX hydrolase [Clostridium sporogenes]|uniref:NUDIX hydrolase n=1 Tax=Clostridium sporogenes TaxID=1509 RepID=UPI0013C73162|nr:NUDIX hydrolase [Clostridium sporogenes]MBU5300685.1 NUDIX hydrolase [Clostridium sporogenes]MBW5456795.1 NUDIX domain-containing protein [Clostridium sporogenes]NFT02958.1 NUDIX hydrolase [Clostridium sporogenes]NFT32881.1 NUDIX hydrolase [Clostridium sporogenes]NFT38414.1 NUDIX hydrolase [Clostridium sporogenes]
MNFYEKTLEEEEIYKGKIINVVKQRVKLPNGKESFREIVKHPGAVAILAYKDEDTVLLIKQFRKAIDKDIFEIPAGKIEKGEDIESSALRELEEETGYKAKKMEYLGKIVTSPGFSDEYIYIYKAFDLYKGKDGLEDEDEFIDLMEISIDKLKEYIKDGKVIDGKTISAVMMDTLSRY